MRRPLLVVVSVVAVVAAACADSPGASRAPRDSTSARRTLVERIEADLVDYPEVPGIIVSVHAPDLDVSVARGYANVATKAPLRVDTPFRIASVTKTFVATATLRLVERDALSLTAPVERYLSSSTVATLRSGGYDPSRITLRELLAHTAGLFDYAASDAYDAINTSDPGRIWTRDEQLAFAMEHGKPIGQPGQRYHYSDTNYILLGEILERATGHSLARAVRDAVGFGRLGLDRTHWEHLEAAPPGEPKRAHQYYDTTFDNIALDASADLFGGGGIVSTADDVTRFFAALFTGKVFDHDATLDEMITVSRPGRSAGAALGIFESHISGERCYGHPGYWGIEAYYCPAASLAFTIVTNQADEAVLDTTALSRVIVDLARGATKARPRT